MLFFKGHWAKRLETLLLDQNSPSHMDYSFKRGFKPDMERIRKVLEEEFPAEIKESDGMLSLSFGALKSIQVSINEKKLNVTTESDTDAKDDQILDTNKRFRNFLEKATGYTAKQRLQMAKKEVSKKSKGS